MKFFGRETQLKSLTKLFFSEGLQVGLIYGRRRIGKSELIKKAISLTNLPALYYEAKQTTETNNTESLALLMSELFQFPKPSFSSIEEELDYLFKKATKDPLILVLDEYSYLRDCVKGLDSILQVLIDKYKESSNLKLILCGSYVDIMKALLMNENPLYGRVDLTINLKPMDYYESALFYPSFSNEDKVRLYSVFGGVPYYNRLINPALSVKENIIGLIASPSARLESEVDMFLKSEISKINNANEVFTALSAGFCRFSDILSQSHVSSSPTLADVLEKLMHMDMVKKEAPINDEKNKKKARYYISDNLSLFYYRYVFRFNSQMHILDPEVFFDRYIAKDFEATFVPNAFETIAKEYLVRQNRAGKIEPPFDQIGKYYYDDKETKTNGEFDVVTKDPDGYVFYEAKFKNSPISKGSIEKEIEQVKATGFDCHHYGFFSKAGFEENLNREDLRLFTLEILYS